MGAEGGLARSVFDGTVSESFALSWLPGGRLLYQLPDNRNFGIVDPVVARETGRLLGAGEVGWIFSPVASPDGRRIVVSWNRPDHRGLWILDLVTGDQRPVHGTANDLVPIAWSTDGGSVYAVKGKPWLYRGLSALLGETTTETTVVNVPLDGREVRTVLVLPFDEVGGVSITPDGRTIVCAVYSSRSDVWMVENFDTAAKR